MTLHLISRRLSPHVSLPINYLQPPLRQTHTNPKSLTDKNSASPTYQNHIEKMESSLSSSTSLKRRASRTCYCPSLGKSVLVVSWTENNPGRRFYGCPNYWIRSELFQNFFSLVRFFSGLFDWFGLNFRLDRSANIFNGLMMRFVCVVRSLSQNKGRPFSYLRLKFQLSKRGRSVWQCLWFWQC